MTTTGWKDEPEFRRMLRQCCDGIGISVADFERLIQIGRDAPPHIQAELEPLLRLMAQEGFPPNA